MASSAPGSAPLGGAAPGQTFGAAPERVIALDLARGLAMLFMVMVHVQDTYGTDAVRRSVFGVIVEWLGSPPAAPVFMFLMGASTAYSSRATLGKGLRRGAEVFALGYLLNFLRGSLPLLLALSLGIIPVEELEGETPFSLFLDVDILQFAGISLAVMALCRRYAPWPEAWVCGAAAIMLVSPFLWGHTTSIPGVHWILNHFWGSGGREVAFPVFPWLCYPLLGMAWGRWFAAAGDARGAFRIGFFAGLVLCLTGAGVTLTNPAFHMGDYYRSGPGAVLAYSGFVLCWLWCCATVVRVAPSNPAFRLLLYWSRNVTVFYFIHWVVIGWGSLVFGYQQRGLVSVVLLMGFVAALSHGLTVPWLRFRRRRRKGGSR